MMRWLLAVVATAILELVTLVTIALWALSDFNSIGLHVGGAVALAAATIVAIWSGARLIGVFLRQAQRRQRPNSSRPTNPPS